MLKLRGFSLLELMIVLLVLGIASSGVSIVIGAFSSPEKELHAVGHKLYAQMNFALDEALVKYDIIGLDVKQEEGGERGYAWRRYEDERWLPIEGNLSAITLAEEMRISVVVDDELLEDLLERALNSQEEETAAPPSIIFYPDGSVSEFELTLGLKENEDSVFIIYVDERGALSLSLDKNYQKERL